VSDNDVIARSPIPPSGPVRVAAGWELSAVHSDADLTITDCSPLAKISVRAPWNGLMAKALGVPFGRTARDGETLVVGSGPGEWLLLAAPGTAAAVTERITALAAESAAGEFVTAVDLTHGRAMMRITGPRAEDLLARLCGVDLADDMTPDGAAFRSSVAGVATDVIRDDRAGARSYLLHCERSAGRYLYGVLQDAGASWGIGVSGFAPPGI
jgi:heterotetrameric sarcosine oxidase gamma subunit